MKRHTVLRHSGADHALDQHAVVSRDAADYTKTRVRLFNPWANHAA